MYKLGKLPPKDDVRTLSLQKYVDVKSLPPLPSQIEWNKKVADYPMYMNDQIGNCAIAGPAHLLQTWSANDGTIITPSDQQVIEGYMKVGGYQPGKPETDNGCYLLDVMNFWRKEGLFGHKIGAFMSLKKAHDPALIRLAIYMFGGVNIGVALPMAAQDMQDVWDLPPQVSLTNEWAHNSWGGHCVVLVGYDLESVTCVTWGKLVKITNRFLEAYCDESFGMISSEWLGADDKCPPGFDGARLKADLQLL